MNDILSQIKTGLEGKLINTPLSEDEVFAFETKHEISLPVDYRGFLLKVGDGGDGPPEYGLLRLGEITTNHVPDYLSEGYKGRLQQPFPFTESWVWEGEEELKGFEEKLKGTEFGCLVLGTDGCGMFWLLIVTGESRGQIWQTSDVGLQPCLPNLTFTQWYKNWLEGNTDWWSE
ncbi:MAG: SMI1/KNR4 family protein [Candidatus Thiodiazotropha sp.]